MVLWKCHAPHGILPACWGPIWYLHVSLQMNKISKFSESVLHCTITKDQRFWTWYTNWLSSVWLCYELQVSWSHCYPFPDGVKVADELSHRRPAEAWLVSSFQPQKKATTLLSLQSLSNTEGKTSKYPPCLFAINKKRCLFHLQVRRTVFLRDNSEKIQSNLMLFLQHFGLNGPWKRETHKIDRSHEIASWSWCN